MARFKTAIIIGLFSGLTLAFPGLARAATLTVGASSGAVTVGQSVTVTVRVNTAGQAINAAQGTLTWSSSLLTATSVSHSGSIFSFWALEPTLAAGRSQVGFIGGLPHPGYRGSAGTIFRVTFSAKAAGQATVNMVGGKILADDGNGTDILTGQGAASIAITAAKTTEKTNTPATPGRPSPVLTIGSFPVASKWYDQITSAISWTKPSGWEGISYVLDQAASTVPAETITSTGSQTTVNVTRDGVWYFHARAKYASGWSATTTQALRRDTTPPQTFNISIERDRGTDDPSPEAVFQAQDETSGIDHYTLQIDDGPAKTVTSPAVLTGLATGSHQILVTAYDRAGLKRTATGQVDIQGYQAPIISDLTSPIMLLDTFTVSGQANAGDTVIIYIDQEVIGQVTAGVVDSTAGDHIVVRAPWSFTSNRILRPGRHDITATARSADGRVSVTTDARSLQVVGRTLLIGGRPVATLAVVPALGVGIIIIILANVFVLVKLWTSFRRLYRREVMAENEIEQLRRRLLREKFTVGDVEDELAEIEEELTGERRRRRRRTGRRDES